MIPLLEAIGYGYAGAAIIYTTCMLIGWLTSRHAVRLADPATPTEAEQIRRALAEDLETIINATREPPRVTGVIWSCPDCGQDLDDEGDALWCPACEHTHPWAAFLENPDDERDMQKDHNDE